MRPLLTTNARLAVKPEARTGGSGETYACGQNQPVLARLPPKTDMRTLSRTEKKSGFDWAVRLARAAPFDRRQARLHALGEAVQAVDGAPRAGSPFGNDVPSIERHRAEAD